MQFQISGTVMQTLAIDLMPGETVYSQTNCMCWMNDAVEMNTNTGGEMLAGILRMFSGGTLQSHSSSSSESAAGNIGAVRSAASSLPANVAMCLARLPWLRGR